MNSFLPSKVQSLAFASPTVWFLSQCAEARGMQKMWQTIRPDIMASLRESAIIQSAESSNRIEGVEVARDRLSPLVLGRVKPRDRPEEEIVGYRTALDFIHANYSQVKIAPPLIKKLHELCQGGMSGDAGQWKARDNDVIEILPNGERLIRFIPVPAAQVAEFTDQLCTGYRDVVQNNVLPDLIAVAGFVFDFLCIHPFRDGNGRVSRLLTLLLLYQHGYDVGRYISIERIIESTKDDYYRTLKDSSQGWYEAQHDLLPWWNYFLSTIKASYQELKDRVELAPANDTMSSLIRQTIGALVVPFTISDICRIHPSIDRELIKKVLHAMKIEGLLLPIGKGRAAKWQNL